MPLDATSAGRWVDLEWIILAQIPMVFSGMILQNGGSYLILKLPLMIFDPGQARQNGRLNSPVRHTPGGAYPHLSIRGVHHDPQIFDRLAGQLHLQILYL